jgi:hypothetical protein
MRRHRLPRAQCHQHPGSCDQQALAGLLVQSLTLCAAAGLVLLGLIYLDGTKVAANANRTHASLTAQ